MEIEIKDINRMPFPFDYSYESLELFTVYLPHFDGGHVSFDGVPLTHL